MTQSNKVSLNKEEETVEQAAIKYAQPVTENKEDMSYTFVAGHFVAGAIWQKEKDRVLIEELYNIVKQSLENALTDDVHDINSNWIEETEKVITKAEQHLKNK